MSSEKLTLQIIIGSTRPRRVGAPIAQWFYELAVARDEFNVELIDLREVNLPILDEPEQASRGRYEHEHTQRWAATIARADALVFVIPEYNYGLNAATKNAVDYLYAEWLEKPYGILSYGGISRGLRAALSLRTSLTALKMFWAGDVSVSLNQTPVVDDSFDADEQVARQANALLSYLARLAPVFRGLRS